MLHNAIAKSGLLIISPAGYSVLFDGSDHMDVEQYKNPATSFVSKVFSESRIRGSSHVSGMEKDNCKVYVARFAKRTLQTCVHKLRKR